MIAKKSATYAYTVYDPCGQVAAGLTKAMPGKRFLSLYQETGVRRPNLDLFSEHVDPITTADSKSSATAAKRSFLQLAPNCVVVVRDLRGVDVMLTALRFLFEEKISSLLIITELPVTELFDTLPLSERASIQALSSSNALVVQTSFDPNNLPIPAQHHQS